MMTADRSELRGLAAEQTSGEPLPNAGSGAWRVAPRERESGVLLSHADRLLDEAAATRAVAVLLERRLGFVRAALLTGMLESR
jgi:hypothetical protein